MPYAYNSDIRIHYEVRGGDGPPLVLMHGLTYSIEDWERDGYVERIDSNYRLILIDGRGHGRSDKPHDPEEYRLSKRAFDVVAVLDDLGIERASYWGFSMGAAIGYGLIWKAPGRVDRLVLGSAHPYEVPAGGPILEALAIGPEAFLELVETARAATGNPISRDRRDEILSMDTVAVAAATKYPDESEEIVPALKQFARPALVYSGELDHNYELIRRVPADAPAVELVTLEGLDHSGTWNSADIVVPIVLDFLNRAS